MTNKISKAAASIVATVTDAPKPLDVRTTGAAVKPVEHGERKLTAASIGRGLISSVEAGMFLPLAASVAIKGKTDMEALKDKAGAALALMIAGLASAEVAVRKWSFELTGKAGDVHTLVEIDGPRLFDDRQPWALNSEGKVAKDAQGVYKAAFQASFFNLPESNPAVWTMTSKAVPIAQAIVSLGMTATMKDGELVLVGGIGDKAQAMREAKSLTALGKVVAEKKGTDRDAPQNDKKSTGEGGTGEGGELTAPSPAEILKAALVLVAGVAQGKEALGNVALSFARKIAALVAEKPEAFADSSEG